jgi:hypothetical protein
MDMPKKQLVAEGEREILGGSVVREGTPGRESNDERIGSITAVQIRRSLQTPRNLPLSEANSFTVGNPSVTVEAFGGTAEIQGDCNVTS